jgi:hypothetical protein
MTDRDAILGPLEARAPALFLVAGGLMMVFAVNTYLKTFTGTSYPVVQGVVAPVGFLVGVVGLFGLYAGVGDPAPALARAAVAVAAVAAVGWVVIVVASIVTQGEPGGPLAVVPLVTIVSMSLAFALFGVTSIRSGDHSRVVGALLLGESAMFLLVVAGVPGFLIDTGHVLAYLGIGIVLRGDPASSANTEPAPDSTV